MPNLALLIHLIEYAVRLLEAKTEGQTGNAHVHSVDSIFGWVDGGWMLELDGEEG